MHSARKHGFQQTNEMLIDIEHVELDIKGLRMRDDRSFQKDFISDLFLDQY